jgi:hypothetical protein
MSADPVMSLSAAAATLPAAYQDAVASIFRSYTSRHHQRKSSLDREVRQPLIIVDLARQLGLLPDPSRIIRITGSKGKGTVSHSIAATLRSWFPDEPVGLLISPQEFEHFDRFRVDGVHPTPEEFVSLYQRLQPALQEAEDGLDDGAWLSPVGTFALLALAWFAERGVRHFVLECGRGVIGDEIGWIPSAVSVVTSILPEHLAELGPALADVARDKISIAASSERVVWGRSAVPWTRQPDAATPLPKLTISGDGPVPGWLLDNAALALAACETYASDRVASGSRAVSLVSPSFGRCRFAGIPCLYDAVIRRESLDRAVITDLQRAGRLLALISLPDGKDRDGIVDGLESQGVAVWHLPLADMPGLSWQDMESVPAGRILPPVSAWRLAPLAICVQQFLEQQRPDALYFAGTHSFIRLVKSLLIMGGQHAQEEMQLTQAATR